MKRKGVIVKTALQNLAFLHVLTDLYASLVQPHKHQTLQSGLRPQMQIRSIHPLPTIYQIHLSIYRAIILHTLLEPVLEGNYTLYSCSLV